MQLFKTLIVAALSTLTIASPIQFQNAALATDPLSGFKVCGPSSDALIVQTLSYAPNPIVAGQDLNITIGGVLAQNVTEGTNIKVTATILGFIKVLDKTIDLCSQAGVVCPIAAGQESITFAVKIPSSAPSVNVDVIAKAFLPDGTELTCVENKSLKV
ncbi:Phosphatidylglycerol/phosphatidylinositol transfer protein [Blyttiomyces sp. JEL0837]|nr:Phosphatidylglycerol/phosphatidylinositol transfer protein [Blyttiomyces sp. JEL0837]